jgi:hypothetical protein
LCEIASFESFIRERADGDVHDTCSLQLIQSDLPVIRPARNPVQEKIRDFMHAIPGNYFVAHSAENVAFINADGLFEVMKIGWARRIVISSISWRVRVLSPLDMEVMCTPGFSRLPSNTGVRESVAVIMDLGILDGFCSARHRTSFNPNLSLYFLNAGAPVRFRWAINRRRGQRSDRVRCLNCITA